MVLLRRVSLGLLIGIGTPAFANAQQAANVSSTANWALAEKFSTQAIARLVSSTMVNPGWILESDSAWYVWSDVDRRRFELIVPAGTKSSARPRKLPLFDHDRMASLLSKELGVAVEANNLPIQNIEFTKEGKGRTFTFQARDARFEYDLASGALTKLARRDSTQRPNPREWRRYSPDSTAYVYAERHNVYLVEIVKGTEQAPIQLTTDGANLYSFGSREPDQGDNDQDDEQGERQQRTTRPQTQPAAENGRVPTNALWSPDSRAFHISRVDSRGIPGHSFWLVNSLAEPRPTLNTYPKRLAGEPTGYREMYVYRRGDKQLTEIPSVHRWKEQTVSDIHWGTTSDRLRMIRRDRLWQNLDLIETDLTTGQTKILISENLTWGRLEGGSGFGNMYTTRYVKHGGDLIWWSERSGWGHFYLYDNQGNFKHALTAGSWRAEGIAGLDSVGRTVWIRGYGREAGENPYHQHLYRTALDNPNLVLLDAGDFMHNSVLSPSRRLIVDRYSTPNVPYRSVLRDNRGAIVMELESMDVSRITAMGWQPPEPFVVKSADGITDIHGNMWKPFDFDPNRKYPIVLSVYPGPQSEGLTSTFAATSPLQSLAQLGFIAIQIGNRGGSPRRSAAYRSHHYLNIRDYGLADKKAGIEQLAGRFPFIDIDRVGLYGHSGGGFMTAAAMLVPPYNEFFKVGVASNGNHDNAVYSDYWAEQNHGLKVRCVSRTAVVASASGRGAGGPADSVSVNAGRGQGGSGQDGGRGGGGGRGGQGGAAGGGRGAATPAPVPPQPLAPHRVIAGDGYCAADQRAEWEIDVPNNADVAGNLKGHLMVAFSDMDNNVYPANSIRLIHALIRANKRFDMLMLPGQAHGFGPLGPYFNRRRDEYFVQHLLGDSFREMGAEIRNR